MSVVRMRNYRDTRTCPVDNNVVYLLDRKEQINLSTLPVITILRIFCTMTLWLHLSEAFVKSAYIT